MTTMTIDDLRRILVSCAGESDAIELGSDIEDRTFDELGYDSLALMETAAKIMNEYGVRIADEQVIELKTPRELLDVVNGAVAEAS